jgi:hypothetical protein
MGFIIPYPDHQESKKTEEGRGDQALYKSHGGGSLNGKLAVVLQIDMHVDSMFIKTVHTLLMWIFILLYHCIIISLFSKTAYVLKVLGHCLRLKLNRSSNVREHCPEFLCTVTKRP